MIYWRGFAWQDDSVGVRAPQVTPASPTPFPEAPGNDGQVAQESRVTAWRWDRGTGRLHSGSSPCYSWGLLQDAPHPGLNLRWGQGRGGGWGAVPGVHSGWLPSNALPSSTWWLLTSDLTEGCIRPPLRPLSGPPGSHGRHVHLLFQSSVASESGAASTSQIRQLRPSQVPTTTSRGQSRTLAQTPSLRHPLSITPQSQHPLQTSRHGP